MSQKSGYTSQSIGDMGGFHKISVGGGTGGICGGVGGGNGGGFYREEIRTGGGYQGGTMQQGRMETDPLSMSAVRQHTAQMNAWTADGSDAYSYVSDRDANFGRQYAQSMMNGYGSMKQGGGTMSFTSPMRRSLSGTLSRGGGMGGGEVEVVQQHSFKGPAHRTISRIANRQRMSMGSMSGQQVSSGGSTYGGGMDRVDKGFITGGVASVSQGNLMQRQGNLSRAMSVKSMQSVGRGYDIYGGQMEMGASMGNLSG